MHFLSAFHFFVSLASHMAARRSHHQDEGLTTIPHRSKYSLLPYTMTLYYRLKKGVSIKWTFLSCLEISKTGSLTYLIKFPQTLMVWNANCRGFKELLNVGKCIHRLLLRAVQSVASYQDMKGKSSEGVEHQT